ncbi:PLP-dependent aminotransferase family protein [Chryseobacterium sp. G0201]|uniref:aminotransferase-like domain-containing protein n=1 Tax=Chryseobacterium sp. G0201 TaxID=2487065 RepID=UPI000F4F58B3|nr:PLP-dependent aminotransferase family protein [Chryseobacterium sp. G0201]AZA53890.1 PLP-dependent aminotransferase family protein [Chryseobacterium sp. G0201]
MQAYKYEIFTSIIEDQIKSGAVKTGNRLPSVREIKEKYKLSISSVQSGYDYLVMKGLVENIPRSGYFVAFNSKENIPERSLKSLPIIKNTKFNKNLQLTSIRNKHVEHGSFNVTAPTDLLIPQKLILRKMQEVIREKGASLLRYYPLNGSQLLREQISGRAARYGCKLNAEELIITDGALQALYIALASVTKAGDVIAVESPCVFSVLEVISNLKLKAIEIPVHYKEGFDLPYLRKICNENNIRAVIVTPNFHNPTGILMTDDAKKELLSIAEIHQIPIIENDIYGDLYFGRERSSNIRNFDESGLVMTFSSFSKTLAPGIRLGWLNPGKFYAETERLKFSLGRSVAPIYQELMIKLLESSSYDRHLRTFRKQLEKQAIELLDVLRKFFPENSYFHRPQGGYSIWGELPENVDMEAFYQYCESQKILFTPGYTFSFTEEYKYHFRAVFADRITSESIFSLKNLGEKVQEFLN